MQTEYDEKNLDFWRIPNGKYIVKFRRYVGLESDNNVKNTLPSKLGAFILSKSKRNMNKFVRKISGFYNNSIYYGDTDSLYKEGKYWDVFNTTNLVGSNLCQGKNNLKHGFLFYGLFLSPKTKYCSTINDCGIIEGHKTFEGLNVSKRLLHLSQYFQMIECKKISAMFPKSWKKSSKSGVVIPAKMRFCNEYGKKNIVIGVITKLPNIRNLKLT